MGAGFHRFGGGQQAHPRADQAEAAEKAEPQHQQPPLGALAGLVAHLLVADAQVLAFDGVGVLALGAGVEDAGERAQRRADHGRSSGAVSARTSIGSVIGR